MIEITIAVSILIYASIGFGVSRMTAKLKNRDVSLVDFGLWPLICIIYAAIGDIAN